MLDQRILVITGAGISAESGIPTFRGTGGYWRNLDPAKLATPEAFQQDPELVWEWYRERRAAIRKAEPNDAHRAVARLLDEWPDCLLVTQNVDNLHDRARSGVGGVFRDRMIKIHGDILLTRCSRCDHRFYEYDADNRDLPLCEKCGALMRPGVVWFGETLDLDRIRRVEAWLDKGPCNHVFVIGTTAMFGYIVDWALRAAGDSGRLIEINPDAAALSEFAAESIREPAGAVLPQLVEDLLRDPFGQSA